MSPRWKIAVAHGLGLIIAAILAVAAFFKAGDPALFADQISAHRLTPASWSPYLAHSFVAVELSLAAALLAFVRPRLLFTGTILLMAGFIFVTAWAWAHGHADCCACFGRLLERGPLHVIIEDSLIAVASIVGLFLTRGFATRLWRWVFLLFLMVPVAALTGFGATLPLDGVVVGIHRGSDLGGMELQDARTPVDQGDLLLVIVAEDCAECAAGLGALREIVAAELVSRVLGAYAGTAAEAQAWRLKHLPSFRLAHAPQKALRQYYRRLPATFLLKEGIVQQVWWRRIPSTDDVRRAAAATIPAGQPHRRER